MPAGRAGVYYLRMPSKTQRRTRPAGKPKTAGPLSATELSRMHAWWRACNYLAVGMIYLQDNPLLRTPLTLEHVKHRLLGHWGTSPALSFVWTSLTRGICRATPAVFSLS